MAEGYACVNVQEHGVNENSFQKMDLNRGEVNIKDTKGISSIVQGSGEKVLEAVLIDGSNFWRRVNALIIIMN